MEARLETFIILENVSHFSFQHLGFVHCPIREHCPAFPHCTDAIVERTVSKRVSRPASLLGDTNHLNIILLGIIVKYRDVIHTIMIISIVLNFCLPS